MRLIKGAPISLQILEVQGWREQIDACVEHSIRTEKNGDLTTYDFDDGSAIRWKGPQFIEVWTGGPPPPPPDPLPPAEAAMWGAIVGSLAGIGVNVVLHDDPPFEPHLDSPLDDDLSLAHRDPHDCEDH